jgi:hypothetical protein
MAWREAKRPTKQNLIGATNGPFKYGNAARMDSRSAHLVADRRRHCSVGICNSLRPSFGRNGWEKIMNSSHPLIMRFRQLRPTAQRFVIGLVFYLLFYVDMRYFAHSALGPWIAGFTFLIFFWAWGIWKLVYIFMVGLFSFVRFYLIFLR